MSISIQQATFYSLYVHCCSHFTTQGDICIHCIHTALISAQSFL